MKSFVKKLVDIRNSIAHGNDFFKTYGAEDTIQNIIQVTSIIEAIKHQQI